MASRFLVFGLIVCLRNLVTEAQTNPNDFAALSALKSIWRNTPPNWVGSDPCRKGWEGIDCTGSRITSIVLAGVGLRGKLSGDIGSLTELRMLDLSQNKGLTGTLPLQIGNLKKLTILSLVNCSFSGEIPDSIGSLRQLLALYLGSNSFTGPIPASIGNLRKLFLLDLTDNKLSGTIPVSNGNSPGLDLLINAKHFHLGRNQFTGPLPHKLFNSNMILLHVLLDSNKLNGSIPSTLDQVQTLEVIRLDRNLFSGPINLDFSSLTSLSELYLSNNQFTGPLPNITSVNPLTYVDLSSNSFDASSIPTWFSSLPSLTSIIMEQTQLQGPVPTSLFSLDELQYVVLRNNHLNGILDIGDGFGSQLELIDLQNNSIAQFEQKSYTGTVMLHGNPVCNTNATATYCTAQEPNSTYTTPEDNCSCPICGGNEICSPNCQCTEPIIGTIHFRSFSFSDLGNATYYTALHATLMRAFQTQKLPVDSISLSSPVKDEAYDYLDIGLHIFPSGDSRFNRTGFSAVTSQMNNISFFTRPSYFGPSYFGLVNGDYFAEEKQSSHTGIIIGAAVGGCLLVLLLLMAGFYAFYQKKRFKTASLLSDPFTSWEQTKRNGSRPQLKGVRNFSFEEIKKCTNNFSDTNVIGHGGYGKVYRGILSSGMPVAIKRAQQGSLQGSLEFKTEIELLSRVHHRNLVSLVGFCYETGEQMLIYEYVPNGTLKDNISGKYGIKLSWTNRLRIALNAARGLTYLHELANPPIIHRDIKSTNILLDDKLVAKVADFGLSKPLGDNKVHVTTQVKGTMGYMDPEYFMTQQLTEKSDVYSFGIVLLELLTGKSPIEQGRHIVTVVRMAIDRTKTLNNSTEVLDPAMGSSETLKGLEEFIDLALGCVEDSADMRPTMSEVVKQIENILQIASPEVSSDSGSTTNTSFNHRLGNKASFHYSTSFQHSEVDLK